MVTNVIYMVPSNTKNEKYRKWATTLSDHFYDDEWTKYNIKQSVSFLNTSNVGFKMRKAKKAPIRFFVASFECTLTQKEYLKVL